MAQGERTIKFQEQNIIFRRAGIDDVPDLIEYRVRFLSEQYNHPENYETRALRKALLEYFSKSIPSRDFIAWVAEYRQKLIATSGMVVWNIPARFRGVESGKLGYLLNFYTVPEARGKGIATRLLDELIKEARSLGLKYLHLHASKEGVTIYKKAGFVEPNMPELVLKLE
ncbi:MAG: GNAT family N-acetyltransferase [Candidatus Hodarchaeota archaeon]